LKAFGGSVRDTDWAEGIALACPVNDNATAVIPSHLMAHELEETRKFPQAVNRGRASIP
jgi:hypothetical protein